MAEDRDQIREELTQVKYIGDAVADQMYEELSIRRVEDVLEAAEKGWLRNLDGIGESTQEQILESARTVLESRPDRKEDTAEAAEEQTGEVSVTNVRQRETGEEEATDETEETDEPIEPSASRTAAEQAAPGREEGAGKQRPQPRIDRFIGRLRCPACGHDTFDRSQATMTCTACRREYEIKNGIADLAPPNIRTGGFSQRLMETSWYSRLYESVMRPTLTRLTSSRSMDEEKALAAEMLELDTSSVVLDVACGTGNFSRYFAEAIGGSATGYDETSLVVGMDISRPMLKRAREFLRRDGLNDRVFLVRGDAARIPLGRETFNRLHCAGALHLMDDIDEALRNFARVLEPGGLCVIGTFLLRGNRLERLAKRVAEVPVQFHWFERDELHDRLERTGGNAVAPVDSIGKRSTVVGN
ncbi:MAG: methyltransferase domain-containing protein [Bradymonadaceae bacterium]